MAMREEAAEKYNECMEDVKKLRERADNLRWRRQEEEEEKRRAAEAHRPVLALALRRW